jgi:hypothetical protein
MNMIRRLLTLIAACAAVCADFAYIEPALRRGADDIRRLCRWHFKRIRKGHNEQSERELLKHAIDRLHVTSAESARARLWLEVSR